MATNLNGTTQTFTGVQLFDYDYSSGANILSQPVIFNARIPVQSNMGSGNTSIFLRNKLIDSFCRSDDGDALHFIHFLSSTDWMKTSVLPTDTGSIEIVGLRVFFDANMKSTGGKMFAKTIDQPSMTFGPLMGSTVDSTTYVDFTTYIDPNGPDWTSNMSIAMIGVSSNNHFQMCWDTNRITLGVFGGSFGAEHAITGHNCVVPYLNTSIIVERAFHQDMLTPTIDKFTTDVTSKINKNVSAIYTSR